jgi:hypothetical protein
MNLEEDDLSHPVVVMMNQPDVIRVEDFRFPLVYVGVGVSACLAVESTFGFGFLFITGSMMAFVTLAFAVTEQFGQRKQGILIQHAFVRYL